jgi:hypothetical protein
MVLHLLGNKTDGTFIDLASNAYLKYSNSYVLETFWGWNGVCIEPNQEYFEGILKNRRCLLINNPVGSVSNEAVTFRLKSVIGGVVGEGFDNTRSNNKYKHKDVTMYTVRLDNILRTFALPRLIEYLSLDIEGYEYFAMKNFDFGYYKFLIMSVERPNAHLHRLLIRHRYKFLACVTWFGEVFYVHESLPNFSHFYKEFEKDRTLSSPCGQEWLVNHDYILKNSTSREKSHS